MKTKIAKNDMINTLKVKNPQLKGNHLDDYRYDMPCLDRPFKSATNFGILKRILEDNIV